MYKNKNKIKNIKKGLDFFVDLWYISTYGKQMYFTGEQNMQNDSDYYIVDKQVLPEVFVKVIKAKQLMLEDEKMTVQDAVSAAGISRSAFYKYKDHVSRLSESKRGRIMTVACNLEDRAGLLSTVLNVIARHGVNILTINQTIPINGVANVTISVDTGSSFDITALIESLKKITGVMALKVIARE